MHVLSLDKSTIPGSASFIVTESLSSAPISVTQIIFELVVVGCVSSIAPTIDNFPFESIRNAVKRLPNLRNIVFIVERAVLQDAIREELSELHSQKCLVILLRKGQSLQIGSPTTSQLTVSVRSDVVNGFSLQYLPMYCDCRGLPQALAT